MSEYPILFSGPMVRAILDGTKTQTRRVVKLREFDASDTPGYDWTFRDRRALWNDVHTPWLMKHCPYGEPGDQLWVRETWQAHPRYFGTKPRDIPEGEPLVYRATHDGPPGAWRPSIYMPRWASRLTLDVTEVRIEQVQDINEEDARAEGAPPSPLPVITNGYRLEFRALWDSINGKRSECSWGDNPWVWAITFEVHQ